ncbi:MAG TPA: hypothetical protein VLY24_00505 [Bryobacteraceae bacterium]|nr:hypothetical protein [Bryobacteraceae bacterium]
MSNQVGGIFSQASARIAKGVADFLPGLLAFILVFAVSILMAFIARRMIRSFLRGIDFDQRVRHWGFTELAEWSPAHSPSLFMAGLTYWLIILIGILIGMSAFDASVTQELVLRLLNYLPHVLAAILIVTVGFFLARFFARSVLISAVNMQVQSARLLSLGVKWLVMLLAGAMALEHLGIGGGIVELSFGILFGGIVLALALAVGLGSKDMVSRSLERQAGRSADEEEIAGRFHHL